MKRLLRVLIVEDSIDDADLLLLELERGDYELQHRRVDTAADMRHALTEQAWDVVLSDFSMPTFSAPQALALLKEMNVDIPFLIVSGTIGEDIAVDALRAGAHDFMVKGRLARLIPAVERELREAANRKSQRDTEVSQRSTEARFRGIMETATDAVVSTDQRGHIDYANPGAEKMFGYAAGELLGKSLKALMTPQTLDSHLEGLMQYLAMDGGPSSGTTNDLTGRRKDGSEFPLDLSFGKWTANGQRHFAAIMRDVTDRKKVEAQLLVADRMVAVGTLAAGMAHEINNPLASVVANVEMAMQDLAEASQPNGATAAMLDRIAEELRDARDGAERVRHIVRDLKIFSRGEDEKSGPVDVQRVMESTLRMAANELRHRAHIMKDYQPVPCIEGSEAKLGQVFMNLLVNAAQAMPEGAADKNEIRISTRSEGGKVVVEVTDTGQGIPPGILSRLFTPFLTTKPVGVGTGLGLSICHRIVTSFGGEIVAASEVGKGTTFKVSLLPSVSNPVTTPVPMPAVVAAPRRGKILVVDDEVMIAKAVVRALGPDHDVTTLQRARAAFERIEAGERFDLILCDLMMPEMTGMDLHREVHKKEPALANGIIFLTGGAFTPRAREFLDSVSNQRIEKPFDIATLRALVNDHIRLLG